jgi:hypothetical protein
MFRRLGMEFHGRGTSEASIFHAISELDRHRHPFRLEMAGAERYASARLAADPDHVAEQRHEEPRS